MPCTIGADTRSTIELGIPPGDWYCIRNITSVPPSRSRRRQRPRWSMPSTDVQAMSPGGSHSTTSISRPTSAEPTFIRIS
jgi:hypothetical protein